MPVTPGFSKTLAVKVESEGVGEFTDSIGQAQATLQKFRGAIGLAGGALAALSTGALVGATNAAREFEQAMVEVEKVTDPQTAREMSDAIREMSETIPLAQTELAQITADAGRFGIQGSENIERFTRVVAKMATATDLSTNEAGQALAKLATLTELPIEQTENLGSAVNELSNNFATSSSEIVDSMLRSSAALSQFGLEADQISALSATLNAVSESSERAGTRLRRLAQEMMNPKKVGDLATALGMTREEFRQMRKESPNRIILELARAFQRGGRQADLLRRSLSTASRQAVAGLSQNIDGLNRAMGMSSQQMREATSLQREFDAATDTFNARLQTMKNRLTNQAITIGNELLPAFSGAVDQVNAYLDSNNTLIAALSDQEKAWGLVALAIAGAGAAGWAFIGGPATALIATSAAIAAAWVTDWADVRTTTLRTFNDISASYNQTLGPTLAELGFQVETTNDLWSAFTTSVAQGFDVIGVGVATVVDLVMTGTAEIIEFGRGFSHVLKLAHETVQAIKSGEDVDFSQVRGQLQSIEEETQADLAEMDEGLVQRTRERSENLRRRTRQRRRFGEVAEQRRAAETERKASETQAQASQNFKTAVGEFQQTTKQQRTAGGAATAAAGTTPTGGTAGGGRFPQVRGQLSTEARRRLGLPDRKVARVGGGEGMRITAEMFKQLQESKGGVSARSLGVSPQEFTAMASAVGAVGGNQQVAQPTPGGGTTSTRRPGGAGAGSSMAPLIREFGSSVSEFKAAVRKFADAIPIEVLVDVDAGEFERAFRGLARSEAETVQTRQNRATDRLGSRGR